jgi:hypothetical protein
MICAMREATQDGPASRDKFARIEPRPKVAGATMREVMRLAQTRGAGKTTGRWAFVTNQRPDIEDAP